MPRRPVGLKQLIPLGGQADSSPNDAPLGSAGVESHTDDGMYVPQFDAKEVMGVFAEGEMGYEMAVDGNVGDEEVDRVTQALLREYLNKKKMQEVLKVFDDSCPRKDNSITSRAKLRKLLGLGEPNKSTSIMEQVITQRIVDTKQGRHVKLDDHPDCKEDTFISGKKPVAWTTGEADMNISVGSFTIDNTGTKRDDRLMEPKSMCDMSHNKIIDHLTDLDIENKEKIGRGASGEVYGVIHKPTGKNVAIKVIKTMDQRKIEEIDKELRLLFDNRCGYIVDFHGSFYDNGNILIALERMSESLNHLVKEGGKMTEVAAQSCVWQTLEALLYLHHERKIIHRDIKPANILYNQQGCVKVSDFGVSSSQVVSIEGNVANTFVGTLAYMSPERCRAEDYSFPSDIWSLGLVLFYLLTATPPYNTCHPLFAIIEGDPPDLEKSSVGCSEAAVDFFAKCVEKDSESRWTCKNLLGHPWFRFTTAGKARQVMRDWVQDVFATQLAKPDTNEQALVFAELDAEL
eukprot:TRINITY_DN15762_c0_g1_i1.p1 TRINITY_DN15762_c0_g1~~TRINITY_DN15762_c0_g1_i1.p1  ORF type:complete len:516 (+),score=90.78 TRINITY_DN15762_c0_g1_i1:46-1593(+)